MVLAVTTSGIQTALSRTVASQTALTKKKEAGDSFCVGTLFALVLSLCSYVDLLHFCRLVCRRDSERAGNRSTDPDHGMQFSICLPACLHQQLLPGSQTGRLSCLYPDSWNRPRASSLPVYLVKIFLSREYRSYCLDCRYRRPDCRIRRSIVIAAFFKSASSCRKLFFFPYKSTTSQTLRNHCHSFSADAEPSASLGSRRNRSRTDSTKAAYVWLFSE